MRVDDTFAASSDIRSGHVGRTQEVQQDQRQRVRAPAPGEDSVSVSSLASQLSEGLTTDSPAEVARVEETRQAVQAGNFNVPAEQLADSLIDSALSGQAEDQRLGSAAGQGGGSG